MPKLFISSDDHPNLSAEALNVFAASPQPKQLVRDHLSYSDMPDDDRKNYESQIASFFLQNLPPTRMNSN